MSEEQTSSGMAGAYREHCIGVEEVDKIGSCGPTVRSLDFMQNIMGDLYRF